MAQIIGLPKLSPTMEEGVLLRWVKSEGDSVEPGDLIAEVETDKANMDFTLEDEGVLLKLLVDEGETIKLGAPVCILGDQGENVDDLVAEVQNQLGGTATSEPPPPSEPAPAAPPPDGPSQQSAAVSSAASAAPAAPAPATGQAGGRLLASPLAKTLAIELGVDLRQISGSGPGGRIVERDVRAAAEGGMPSPAAAPEAQSAAEAEASTALAVIPPGPISVPGASDEYVDKPLSNIRKTIAARLTAAKRDVPHFRLTTSYDASALLAFRKRLNELLGNSGKVTINDLLIKGAALALRRVPECNAAFIGDAIRYYARIHIGVAVALERGLVTPVVRSADLKGIGVIAKEVKDLVQRAKDRKLKAEEIQGSTLTISNLGMFGIDHFDAIINPPEAAILAVGRINKIPTVTDEGHIEVAHKMTITMSCDHRVIDGAVGARYLDELVSLLESPESLAL